MQHGADVIARGAESLLDAGEAGAVAHLGADTALEHQVMSPSRGSSAWPRASANVYPGTAALGADDDAEQPGRLGDHASAAGDRALQRPSPGPTPALDFAT
jgi:hypothetical protein